MSLDWIKYASLRDGERLRESYYAVLSGGTLFRELISYTDSAGGLIKEVAEASHFVPEALTSLSWSKESINVDGERTEELHSAVIPGGRLYRSTVVYLDGGSGPVKKVALSLSNVPGVLIGFKDNATSMRVTGLQHPMEGTATVRSYSGIFYNDAYDNTGALKTRVIHGANLEMDIEIQGPHQVRLAAVDDTQSDGKIYIASKTDMVFNMRADAEVASPKRLVLDRLDTGSSGVSNTSDVSMTTNSGKLYLQAAHVSGGVVLPSYTTTERDALTPASGEIIFNATLSVFQGYDGTSWVSL